MVAHCVLNNSYSTCFPRTHQKLHPACLNTVVKTSVQKTKSLGTGCNATSPKHSLQFRGLLVESIQVCYRMTRGLVPEPWTIRTGLSNSFSIVSLATYKNLKLPRRLRFKERMKTTLNTTYGGIPVILPKAVNPWGKKSPFSDEYLYHKLARCRL